MKIWKEDRKSARSVSFFQLLAGCLALRYAVGSREASVQCWHLQLARLLALAPQLLARLLLARHSSEGWLLHLARFASSLGSLSLLRATPLNFLCSCRLLCSRELSSRDLAFVSRVHLFARLGFLWLSIKHSREFYLPFHSPPSFARLLHFSPECLPSRDWAPLARAICFARFRFLAEFG